MSLVVISLVEMAGVFKGIGKKVGVSPNQNTPLVKDSSKRFSMTDDRSTTGEGTSLPRVSSKKHGGKGSSSPVEKIVAYCAMDCQGKKKKFFVSLPLLFSLL